MARAVTAPCDDRRGEIAAAALGRLSPEERAVLDQHLASCTACREELDALLPVAALLPLADPLAARDEGAPADLELRVLRRLGDEVHRQRSRRRATVLVAAAAVLVAGVVGALAFTGSSGAPSIEGERVAFTDAPEGVGGWAVIGARGEGTVVELHARGLDPDTVYALWLSSHSGDRLPAGTFRPSAEGEVEVRLPCALGLDDTERIWATTPDGEVPLDAWLD